MVLCLLHVTSAVAPLLASKLLRRTARSAVGLQYGNYESVQGVGYESPQGYLEQPVLALDGAVGVTGFAYSMQAHDRYLHLPYVLRLGEEQVLSRWNMVRQKLTVSREQCKVAVAADGAALLLSTGRGPTMWRSRAASEWPCGPWNALYNGQVRVIEDGDQLSLDCNDPDDAVFTCHVQQQQQQQQQPQQQQQQQQQGYAAPQGHTLPAGWTAGLDEATGGTYYYNERTGESQWEFPQ